jgi:aryl-alcohol dehydrogenase-like predicted oxidoreductase
MKYGIANKSGMARPETVSAILGSAQEAGVTVLDTAWAYGDSERVLGEQEAVAAGFQVVTKTRPLKGMGKTPAESADFVEEAFHDSLSKLGATSVYGLLVHHADDLLGLSGDALWERLQRLRAEGLAEKIGCSLYRPEDLARLLDRYEPDLIQLPYSIYDQRYVTSGMSSRAKALGIEVHVRSAFLQGVLLIPPDRLPDHLGALREHHTRLWAEYEALEVTPLRAAIGFCLDCTGADRIIVGCEQLSQWNEILAAAGDPLPAGLVERLSRFAIEDEAYINPSHWQG